jgi:hypothetical protein
MIPIIDIREELSQLNSLKTDIKSKSVKISNKASKSHPLLIEMAIIKERIF